MGRASFPERYESILVGSLFRPWVDDLLQRATLAPGAPLLDLACGTGIVARLAGARLGPRSRVVGLDASAPMLEVARRLAPQLEWREGDACALPFGAGEAFGAVVCQQGFQFFSDPPAAAREIRRVLAPGGKAVIATWRSLDENPFFGEMHRVAERHLGPVVDRRHRLGEAALHRYLSAAGFGDIGMEKLARTLTLDDPAAFLHMNAMALVGMSGAGKALDEAGRERLVAAIARDCAGPAAAYRQGAQLVFAAATTVATATK